MEALLTEGRGSSSRSAASSSMLTSGYQETTNSRAGGLPARAAERRHSRMRDGADASRLHKTVGDTSGPLGPELPADGAASRHEPPSQLEHRGQPGADGHDVLVEAQEGGALGPSSPEPASAGKRRQRLRQPEWTPGTDLQPSPTQDKKTRPGSASRMKKKSQEKLTSNAGVQTASALHDGCIMVNHHAAQFGEVLLQLLLGRVPGVLRVNGLLADLVHLPLVDLRQPLQLGLVRLRHALLLFIVDAPLLDDVLVELLPEGPLRPQHLSASARAAGLHPQQGCFLLLQLLDHLFEARDDAASRRGGVGDLRLHLGASD